VTNSGRDQYSDFGGNLTAKENWVVRSVHERKISIWTYLFLYKSFL